MFKVVPRYTLAILAKLNSRLVGRAEERAALNSSSGNRWPREGEIDWWHACEISSSLKNNFRVFETRTDWEINPAPLA